jgi:hypothetical protein
VNETDEDCSQSRDFKITDFTVRCGSLTFRNCNRVAEIDISSPPIKFRILMTRISAIPMDKPILPYEYLLQTTLSCWTVKRSEITAFTL